MSQLTQTGEMLAVAGVGSVSCCERAVAAAIHRAACSLSEKSSRQTELVTMVLLQWEGIKRDLLSNGNYKMFSSFFLTS